ncbi:MAG: hypothetical protein A2600_04245 [Candidatus Lambdaproteobacteria bacterium RIFOXYD1_FULL_56_27]|uniref:Flagellin n=1 Tax=Candidatus Lambdaproteobacteria bacterium RIFOXYD2_FULL_56_26 TaxID=1817773 RepID=A0A1F6H3Q3_9PROT|nr:MAG: hypothetical protein A2426_02045 [Candidatus Lambdaproteobacteria bacterium RIFOXYC1_FULL_56_13]OGH04966.1 MAG: hypothetical protein A2557_08310 [Candidatus Lambdaproteobacteria bacterium RIFOXYD2_FULL_56_26]OGH09431.1 MAG: hypothetical protein A2600_04245 [Candidatus Lambdaproteobacteria bacterium RIFOXYD1_FULL_56_27]
MRVTDQTKNNAVQKSLSTNAEELQNLMVGMANGKKLNKPSDDPVGAALVQDFHTSIDRSKSLEKNIGSDKVWLNATESAVSQISDMVLKIKEMTLKGANGGVTKEERMALSKEIEMMTQDLVKLVNKKEGKLFLFSGTKTLTEPLKLNSKLKEAEIKFDGLRVKSERSIIPLDQTHPINKVVPGITPGKLELLVEPKPELDAEGNPIPVPEPEPVEGETPKPKTVSVELTGEETVQEVVKKINDAFIAKGNYQEDPSSPSGYKADLFAQMGVDNHLYLDPAYDHDFKILSDTTGLAKGMGFHFLGQEKGPALGVEGASGEAQPAPGEAAIPFDEFEPLFRGYSKENYIVKVVQGGTYGTALYVVSDDDGKTWSPKQSLNKQIEIFNPEGKPSDQIRLQFEAPGKPYFMEGLEFRFTGNEFVEYHGNDVIKEVPIDNGIKVALNTTATELLMKDPEDPETVDTFEVLNRLMSALEEDDQQTVIKSVQEIDNGINQVLKKRAEIGSRVLELESSEDRLSQNIDSKGAEMSKIQDMDLAKGSIDLNKAELKHKSALDASARLIQPTLVQFLK